MDPDGSISSSSSRIRSNDASASTSASTKEQAKEQALLFSFIRHEQWTEFEDRVRSKINTNTPHTLWTARVETEDDCQFFGIFRRDDDREDENDGDENEKENFTLLNALLLCRRNNTNRNSSLEVPPLSTIQCLIERTDEYVEEQRQKQKQKQRDSAAAASKATAADEIMPLVALTTNEYQDTPLHQVCATMAERNDIVKYLISKYPDAVCKKNNLYYRPIDIMSNRIIMLEEVMKYNNHTGSTSNRTTSASTNTSSSSSSSNHTNALDLTNEMDRMWTTVYELAKAAVSVSAAVNADTDTAANADDTRDNAKPKSEASVQQQQEGKELFTFVKCPEFPICLFQRALKRYSQRLLNDVDNSIDKNRLLHIIIQNNPQNRRPSTRSNNNDNGHDSENDDSDEDEDNDTNNRELFPYILKADPKAASVMNGHNQIPLKLAIKSGYSLSSTTIQSLIKTYPEGLNMLELPSNIIPKVLERLVGESKTTAAAATTTRFRTTDSQRRDMLLIVFKYLRSANASSRTTSKRKSK